MVTAEPGDLIVRIDGSLSLSAELVAALDAVCERAEDHGDRKPVIVHTSGSPEGAPAGVRTVALVSKWERALRRLERLPAVTIAVASGECGGLALEALLATDYRIATASLRLLVPVESHTTWPGMALYRLVQQAGAGAVRRAVLFGTPIVAADAVAMRLIDELTGDEQSALTAAADRASAFPGTEVAIRRQLMLDASAVTFEEALGAHLAACDRMLRRASAGAVP